jgi:hypothetical protein
MSLCRKRSRTLLRTRKRSFPFLRIRSAVLLYIEIYKRIYNPNVDKMFAEVHCRLLQRAITVSKGLKVSQCSAN